MKQVIVLGRGRSGTSLTAGLIDKMGIDMGKDRAPSANNPRGYFEDMEIMEILDRYFAPIEKNFIESKEFEKDFKGYVKKKKGSWGWKQPKTLYVLPLIVKYLNNPYFVVCHRDIEKQAGSIRSALNRNKTHEETKKVIIDYYDLLEKWFKDNDYPRLDVQFEDFFTNQEKSIKNLCGFVGGKYSPELKDFIDPKQPKYL